MIEQKIKSTLGRELNVTSMLIREALIITEQGIETIGKLWPVIENSEKQILTHFSENEVNTFITMINRIKENCLKI